MSAKYGGELTPSEYTMTAPFELNAASGGAGKPRKGGTSRTGPPSTARHFKRNGSPPEYRRPGSEATANKTCVPSALITTSEARLVGLKLPSGSTLCGIRRPEGTSN